MGGRGAKSGGSPGSPGQARPASEPQKPTSEPPRERPRKLPDGRVEGVEYLRTPYPRNPTFGEYTPIVTAEGLRRMLEDMERIGMKAPITNAPLEELPEIAQNLNGMERYARAETLRKATQRYLKRKTGKKPSHDEVEEQLNLWGLTGKPFIVYHPPRKEIYEHPEKPPETPAPPVETPPPVKEKKERKRREREKTVSLEEFLEANDKKYLKNNPHVWYYDELKTLRHEQKPYATIDAATGEIRVKDLYQYRGPIKRLGFEFDTSGWWYKPIGETPAKNREIVTALRNIGIPVKMTERTVLETQYNRTLAQEIYSRSPEKAQEIIDKNAKKTLRRYGLI